MPKPDAHSLRSASRACAWDAYTPPAEANLGDVSRARQAPHPDDVLERRLQPQFAGGTQ